MHRRVAAARSSAYLSRYGRGRLDPLSVLRHPVPFRCGFEFRRGGSIGCFRARLERNSAKWIPARRQIARQIKNLERASNSVKSDRALDGEIGRLATRHAIELVTQARDMLVHDPTHPVD